MISDMLVISALSIYFDSLWDYFHHMIYFCSKLNLFPVIIVTKRCPIMHSRQHDGNINWRVLVSCLKAGVDHVYVGSILYITSNVRLA